MSDISSPKTEGPVAVEPAKGHIPAAVMQRVAARVRQVPAGPTLIDQISDADWHADHSQDNINAGK